MSIDRNPNACPHGCGAYEDECECHLSIEPSDEQRDAWERAEIVRMLSEDDFGMTYEDLVDAPAVVVDKACRIAGTTVFDVLREVLWGRLEREWDEAGRREVQESNR